MKDLQKPEEYKDVIEVLGKENILPRDFAKKLPLPQASGTFWFANTWKWIQTSCVST
ncbi:MAG: hypothetical protein WED04_11530 [Promethearchaeati archaeon SRVP18_Atabeyarchaeia-1]